jgi:predicted kinase
MDAVIFIGLQAAGKSSFYRDWTPSTGKANSFFNTHIRINLDMLKTRHREKILFEACLTAKQSFVIDNTNPDRQDREKYIIPAKEKGFRIIGYYFQSLVEDCLTRNNARSLSKPIPDVALYATKKKLEIPGFHEGFDELYYVKIGENKTFIVEEWQDEI